MTYLRRLLSSMVWYYSVHQWGQVVFILTQIEEHWLLLMLLMSRVRFVCWNALIPADWISNLKRQTLFFCEEQATCMALLMVGCFPLFGWCYGRSVHLVQWTWRCHFFVYGGSHYCISLLLMGDVAFRDTFHSLFRTFVYHTDRFFLSTLLWNQRDISLSLKRAEDVHHPYFLDKMKKPEWNCKNNK